jgi:hypothetical protein
MRTNQVKVKFLRNISFAPIISQQEEKVVTILPALCGCFTELEILKLISRKSYHHLKRDVNIISELKTYALNVLKFKVNLIFYPDTSYNHVITWPNK